MEDSLKNIVAVVLMATGTYGFWAYGETASLLAALSLSVSFLGASGSILLLVGFVQMTAEGIVKERAARKMRLAGPREYVDGNRDEARPVY